MEVNLTDCPNCRRLEEEKAQLKEYYEDQLERRDKIAAKYVDRLAQAEAREAAMREALTEAIGAMSKLSNINLVTGGFGEVLLMRNIDKAIGVCSAALSPDAGRALIDGSGIAPVPPVSLPGGKTPDSKTPSEYRALAAEVKRLREVARVLQNTTPEALRQLVTELFMQGRSAWAYLFTDLATSMVALAKRREEGKA